MKEHGRATKSEKLNRCLSRYLSVVQNIYGNLLKRVVLFGSYARGDYHEDSDVDIMIFLDVEPQNERDNIHQLLDVTFDFNMDDTTIIFSGRSVSLMNVIKLEKGLWR